MSGGVLHSPQKVHQFWYRSVPASATFENVPYFGAFSLCSWGGEHISKGTEQRHLKCGAGKMYLEYFDSIGRVKQCWMKKSAQRTHKYYALAVVLVLEHSRQTP